MKVYLAHSGHEKELGKEIETRLVTFGYDVLNPFDKEENLNLDNVKWVRGKIIWKDLEERVKQKISDWIVTVDYESIDEAEIVVCIYPEDMKTIGIPCEMAYAFLTKKPTYIYAPPGLVDHPWIIKMSLRRFSDLHNLLACLELVI